MNFPFLNLIFNFTFLTPPINNRLSSLIPISITPTTLLITLYSNSYISTNPITCLSIISTTNPNRIINNISQPNHYLLY
jgi:hypothetical protein